MNNDILKWSSKQSAWSKSFTFEHVKCLIVCRGPIRKEAIEIFESLGTQPCGILLSDKDSIVYPQTLAPELRMIKNRKSSVHSVPDYTGASKEEKIARINQIIQICKDHGYTHLFAGYGFMAEDGEFIESIENADIVFVGPGSHVAHSAGAKDEAKLLARKLGVSVTPGVDNITALTLLAKAGTDGEGYLKSLISQYHLEIADGYNQETLERKAEYVLQASYDKRVDLITIPELQKETAKQIQNIWSTLPGRRIRLKHIGGGGGKGQRIVQKPEEIAEAVKAVLIESKATGTGDNKNFLIELNIENTRHNEVQLLGNGEWCVELGARDCSLQMHEQKLLEVSLTEELLEASIRDYEAQGKTRKAEVLKADLKTVRAMCQQAQKFGEEIRLNSASTFECIVEKDSHYFMEVNTRIQVEHRVTEMAYSLKFANPADTEEYFILDSLVGAMLFIACHGKQVPKPERLPRHVSGCEARINATNAALKPHAGGILRYWSPPLENELRDDQGIGILNPDTGLFQSYNLAGAYDSNVALIVNHGESRLNNFQQLANILRKTEIRGTDLHLNIGFHYGLLNWLIGNDAMVKPSTRFVQSYLALIGHIRQISDLVNLDIAWNLLVKRVKEQNGKDAVTMCETKQTLLTRPLKILLDDSHLMAGWLATRPLPRWKLDNNQFIWVRNPLEILDELYHYVRLEEHPGVEPSEQIWEDDQKLITRGLDFYKELKQRLGKPDMDWQTLDKVLSVSEIPENRFTPELWANIQASHRGFQLGMDILKMPAALGKESQFFDFHGNDELEVEIPAIFTDSKRINEMITALAPPPPAKSNEILSWTGGTFYSRETPTSPPYVTIGQHVETGEIVGLLEVMKMFNPIRTEFPGTIKSMKLDGSTGVIVARGQVLFEIEPDIPPVIETEEEILKRQKEETERLMQWW
ncbi:MAG: biotin carboxylase [SAR324 cluster bacterium]|nr:biotin carboxylase [SAR324 cluster bacterium]